MKYCINKRNYRDFSKFEENRLPHRAYFIPFLNDETMSSTTYLDERFKSDAVLLLSGQWDFAYFKSASRLQSVIDTQNMTFDKVSVPSTWQKTGYDKINYLNSMYPFACRPPKTPKNCPVGVYRKNFEFEKQRDFTYFITFLGVCASLDLYVNGKYVGYSEGSHNSAEFDLTEYLNDGENELLAVVYKWSTGTYLECQDMFRENGIFRDVYITKQPKSYLFDFRFNTKKSESGYLTNVQTYVKGGLKAYVKGELFLDGEKISSACADENGNISFGTLDVEEWNAETHICYDLIITVCDENQNELQFVRQKIGFRSIELQGFRYLWNGKNIKLKGVNHHDTHPVRGYAMTREDLKKDIELMKEFNVNCVRTSHYPPDPVMITMCDMYGIYVVDEADIETHGCFVRNIDLISNDPKWESHYIDRVAALYERDKNHPSIAMWSMGNEAGGISNFDACYEFLKSKTNIPVHYEPACRSKRVRYDILAHFYTPPEEMRALSRGMWKGEKNYDAPFFLCEYAHSMGVGPGALDEYWDIIYSDDRFLGGCIWEWADHAHYDENAKYKYTYGGDHKDRLNNGNFCCDGLFYPDRVPSTSAYCMKNVYSPLRADYSDGVLSVRNTNCFTSSEGINILCYLFKNGSKELLTIFDHAIEPQKNEIIPVKFSVKDTDDAFLILEYRTAANDKLIGMEQKILSEHFLSSKVSRADLKWESSDRINKLTDGKNQMIWDKYGRLCSLTDKNGKEILSSRTIGFVPMLYQAVIDNHVYAVAPLKKAGIDKLRASKFSGKADNYLNTVQSHFYLSSKNRKRFEIEIVQRAVSEKEIYVTVNTTSLEKRPLDMLQIGVTLELKGDYQFVKYYGMGEEQSYSDFNSQSVMGIYNTQVSKMYVSNIKPQESGNHNMVRFAEITDADGSGIRITALDNAFDFKAVDIDEENLRKARHMEDVEHTKSTFVHVNGFVRGIGSQSCGPDTAEKYKKILHYKENFTYSFKIEII